MMLPLTSKLNELCNQKCVNVVAKLMEDVEQYMGFTNSHISTSFLPLPSIAVLNGTEYMETEIIIRLCLTVSTWLAFSKKKKLQSKEKKESCQHT